MRTKLTWPKAIAILILIILAAMVGMVWNAKRHQVVSLANPALAEMPGGISFSGVSQIKE